MPRGGNKAFPHPGWPAQRTSNHEKTKKANAESQALCALEVLTETMGYQLEELVDVFVQDRKVSVRAKKELQIGELVLVPETWSVKILKREANSLPLEGTVEIFFNDEAGWENHRVLLTGQTNSDMVSPFWCLERTTDDREVSMITVLMRVQLCGGPDAVSKTVEDFAEERVAQRISAVCKAAPRPPGAAGKSSAHALALRALLSRPEHPAVERLVWLPVL